MDEHQPVVISPQTTPPVASAAPEAPQVPPSVSHDSSPPPSQWQFNAGASSAAPQTVAMPPPTATEAPAVQAVSWTNSEFIGHEKSASWYGLLGIGAVILAILVFLLTHDKTSIGVVLAAAIVLGIVAGRKPQVIEYKVNESGVTIGAKFYGYDLFKSFAVVDEGTNPSVILLPLKRFMTPQTLYYEPKDEDQIVSTLADYLPLENHKVDAVDRLMHRIRF